MTYSIIIIVNQICSSYMKREELLCEEDQILYELGDKVRQAGGSKVSLSVPRQPNS